jgi:hypothetical protein
MMSREETSKYTELVPDGTARQFTFVMDAKSLITAPSLGKKMQGPGLYQITGLAWSGRGRIARVEVSADGGESFRSRSCPTVSPVSAFPGIGGARRLFCKAAPSTRPALCSPRARPW